MGLTDPHDPREFLHYAKLADDGTVAAIIEVASTAPPPLDRDAIHVDVTDQIAAKARALVIAPAVLTRVAALTAFKATIAADRAIALKDADALRDPPIGP